MLDQNLNTNKYGGDRDRLTSSSHLYSPNRLILMLSLILTTATISVICGTIWSLTNTEDVQIPISSATNTSQKLILGKHF